MDRISPEKRSWNMSRIRGRDTLPELQLRKALHRMGFRYRLHEKKLPGSPDIVFPRFKAVLFVHGCFWHRHGCKATTTPGTNVDFWRKKFDENIARDRRQIEALQDAGWRVAVVWQCALEGKGADPEKVAILVKNWLISKEKHQIIPPTALPEAFPKEILV